jgi:hypothetical protein
VLEGARANALDAEVLKASPEQPVGGREVQPGLAVEQRPLCEQPARDQPVQPLVGPAVPHSEAAHYVLGAGRAHVTKPGDDLAIAMCEHRPVATRRQEPDSLIA